MFLNRLNSFKPSENFIFKQPVSKQEMTKMIVVLTFLFLTSGAISHPYPGMLITYKYQR